MRRFIVLFSLMSCSAPNQFRSNAGVIGNGEGSRPKSEDAAAITDSQSPGNKAGGAAVKGSETIRAEPNANPSASSSVADSEQVVPPTPINGSYLHCAVQLEPSDLLPEGNVACRLEDSAQNRLDPAALNALALFKLTAFDQPGFTGSLTVLTSPDRSYEVTLAFKGRTRIETAKAMRASTLQLDLLNLETSQVISSQKNSIGLVETKTQTPKWQTVAGTSLDTYLDTATGLSWTGDDQNSYTVQEATNYCNDLELNSSSSWAVPSLAQLSTARNHGIGSHPIVALDAMALKSGARYWTSNRYVEPASGAVQAYTMELVNNLISSASAPTPDFVDNKGPVLCVAGPL